uniref:Hypoxia-inducible factor 1-alpha n=1 Tax=Cacopsylla melanoneura TaxID=428564 RepID=A0A8D8UHZ1_9HEMI
MDSKVKPKEKRRNSERRKEKSRDAARCRRSKESEIFHDMASLLPLPASTVTSLDKASVMRLAISFLKTKHILNMIPAVASSSSRSLVSSDYSSRRDCSVSPVSSVSSSSSESSVRSVSGPGCRDNVVSESCRVTSGGSGGSASSVTDDALYLKALDGFVLVLSTEGDLVFLSENVNHHLGLSQIDLMGQSIYEVTHPCDHNEVKSILSTKDVHTKRSMFIRFKCTLTSKGRNVNVKAASYKVIHCTGHLVRNETPAGVVQSSASTDSTTIHDPNNNKSYGTDNKENNSVHSDDCEEDDQDDEVGDISGGVEKRNGVEAPSHCFIAIGEPIPHPSNYDVPLSQTFLTKHSLDMKFTYADETMEDFLGFNPDIFIGNSVFEFHHAQDSFHVQNAFKSLFAKGQCQTDRYRFLACGGGYVWVLTQATLIYSKCQKPQSVVCVNFVISGIEEPDQIFSRVVKIIK